jgi:Glyoxalase-like domain
MSQEGPSTHFDLVTIDAVNSEALSTFWSAALGLHITETEDDGRWVVLGSDTQHRVIGIQRITGLVALDGTWDGPTKPRIHLDLACTSDAFVGEVERLLGLGAARVRPDRVESYGSIATLKDTEGNVFDLCAYY